MIAHIKGILSQKTPDSVVVDVGGVGYELFIPLSTFYNLPEEGEGVFLHAHTQMREDALILFGFHTMEEKELFRLLISVTSIGPKVARNILSGIGPEELKTAIASSDKARLATIPGIGGKSAERLILELKDKVKTMAVEAPAHGGSPEEGTVVADVLSALDNLGYKAAMATEAVKKAKGAMAEGVGFEELFKEALKLLSKK